MSPIAPRDLRAGFKTVFRCRTTVPTVGMLAMLVLPGCAVGPDYQRPDAPAVNRYTPQALPEATVAAGTGQGDAQRFLQGRDVPTLWWATFNSGELTRRVFTAFGQSPTVASAQAALQQAQENLDAARAGFFPAFDAGAGATRQKESVAQFGSFGGGFPLQNAPFTVYNASVSVSYIFDLFGSVRRSVEAQAASVDNQRAQLDATYITLAANVVTTSLQEASLREQISATEQIIAMQRAQFEIARKRQEIGARSLADTLAVQTQLATTRTTLPPLRKQLAATQNQLATYLGVTPAQLQVQPLWLDAVTLPPDIPVTLPSRLVAQRPDIRASSAQLHVATAQVGVATAALLPQLTLSGSLGSAALSAGDVFSAGTGLWSLGVNLTQPLFQGGRLRANRRAAQAGLNKALADWQSVVLSAFQNVADALQALQFDAQGLAAAESAERAAARLLDLTRRQFKIGATGYLNLLDAESSFQQARIAVIQARAARLSDTAALYVALGGGWQNPDAASAEATPVSASESE